MKLLSINKETLISFKAILLRSLTGVQTRFAVLEDWIFKYWTLLELEKLPGKQKAVFKNWIKCLFWFSLIYIKWKTCSKVQMLSFHLITSMNSSFKRRCRKWGTAASVNECVFHWKVFVCQEGVLLGSVRTQQPICSLSAAYLQRLPMRQPFFTFILCLKFLFTCFKLKTKFNIRFGFITLLHTLVTVV